MKTTCRFGVALLALLGTAVIVRAADWFVDNQSVGNNTGTNWANAFTNLSYAVTNVWGAGANTGDTIYVRQVTNAANYSARVVIGAGFADGTPSSYNTIVGWSGSGYKTQPVIVLSGSQAAIFDLGVAGSVGRNFYEFRNLSFQGASYTFDRAVKLNYNSSNVRFVSNTCNNADFAADDGADVAAKTNLLLQANAMLGGSSFMFRQGYYVQILDNNISPYNNDGILMYSAGGGFLIQGNDIWGNSGINSGSYSDVTVTRNRIYASYTAGIYLSSYPNRWQIYNNIIHDCVGSHATYPNGVGILVVTTSNPDLKIYNNTIHNLPEVGSIGIWLNSNVDKAVVFNNIISTASYGLYFETGCTSTNDYNDFWSVGTKYSGAAVAGIHDLDLNPMFVNPANPNLNFTLGNNALKYSAANPFNGISAPLDDYYGAARYPRSISFGAVQFPVLRGTIMMTR